MASSTGRVRPRPSFARVRGLNPWPGVTIVASGRPPRDLAGAFDRGTAESGVLIEADGRLSSGTGAGLLEPVEVQSENRRTMDWEPYLRGARLRPERVWRDGLGS